MITVLDQVIKESPNKKPKIELEIHKLEKKAMSPSWSSSYGVSNDRGGRSGDGLRVWRERQLWNA